ncbi:MAG: sulfur carrier protein ThiS adenylyltransferase ThiF [Planctomycetota bacterium]
MIPSDPKQEAFEKAFSCRNVIGSFETLQKSVVGILGAGGLGSNAAAALVRAGVGTLIIADPDAVEVHNLNRQLYFLDQVGMRKVEALAVTLKRINPYVSLRVHSVEVTPENLISIFNDADLLIEALDLAATKARLIEAWLVRKDHAFVVAASGLAGIGRNTSLDEKRMNRLIVCGDGQSPETMGLCAGRVGAVANMQANAAVEILLAVK